MLLFNRGEAAADISASWGEVALASGKAKVRDLWAHADRGVFTDSFKANVPSHGVVMLKVVSTR